ncbi:hypothetical protein F2Q68_00032597 [Brassica cretica]|uniref:Uncharacterized protein n=1 Tax=Brassica cretica TaxID=69181 RepID=A0A8S9GDH0_BRACR|nr:hypothetical protein F2Q68_00032597 [Brassica cretica]
MGSLSTPNTGEGTTNATPASGAAGATREGIEDHQVHDLEESDSEPETEKEEPDKTSAESSITAYLEQMFSKRFDAMKSMVERLPGDVLSRAWAHVKWEEDIASRAKAQPKQDQRSTRLDREDREERSSQKGSKDSGSRNRGRFQ